MWKLFFLLFVCLSSESCASEETLILTHIIYRHGNRTPNFSNLPVVNNPFANESFYPYGIGHLTLDGRKRAYHLGIKLRKRYSEFLGDLYYADLIEARSSGLPRSIMSMQSVLAGLFPPTSEWELKSGLEWQPVYFVAPSVKEDKLIYANCDKINKVQGIMDEHFYNYVKQNTGINITSFFEMMRIWNIYHNLEELGYELPEWVLAQWPQPFAKYGLQYWKGVADQTAHYVIGPLLKKINDDTMKKIDNTLVLKDRKMFMYSGHDVNIVAYLGAIGVYKENLYINYSASILIEVHQIKDDYFVKVLFDNYDGKVQVLKIPACGGVELCPLNTYISITEDKYGPEEWCT